MSKGQMASGFLKQRYVISDVLKQVGLNILAEDAAYQENESILRVYLLKAHRVAYCKNDTAALEQLWAAGLIYAY